MAVETWTAFKYQMGLWKIFGILPPPTEPLKRFLYIFHAIFVNIFGLMAMWTMFFMNVYKSQNLGEFLEFSYPTITTSSIVLKLLNCFMQRDHLLAIRESFRQLDTKANSTEEQQLLKKSVNRVYSFLKLFANFTGGITVCGIFTVIFSDEATLFLPAWYPWDWKKSRKIYLLTLTHQLYAIIFVSLQETVNAAYPQGYLEMLTAHVKTLRLRVLKLGRLQQKPLDVVLSSHQSKTAGEQEMFEALTACIQEHTKILQLYNEVQAILSVHCLIQLLATGLVQCAIAISVLYTDISEFSKIMQMLFFLCAITIEMFALCYSGEMFCQECENLSIAIYNCNWISQSLRFQKALVFFLHRSQQYSVVMAGNFMPINYPTFVSLVKGAYSAFALLNNFRQH